MASYKKNSKWIVINQIAINLDLVRSVEKRGHTLIIWFSDDHNVGYDAKDAKDMEDIFNFILGKIGCD
jgi:galactose-1-phosphate uridylyltransferase